MADSFWKLEKDSTFNTDLKCAKILYHSNLNVVLVITKDGDVLVYDGTSGAELHKTKLSGAAKDSFLDGVYVGAHNKLILTNGVAVGMRSDYNGMLLFDTILQPTVQKSYDQVEIELPLFEAQLIYQALKQVELPTAESVVDLINKLEVQIAQNGNNPNRDSKAEKWDTIRLKSTHNSLKWVASTMASELRRQNRYIPALSIASSINERLNCLLPPVFSNANIDRTLMFSEANRRETFTKWPHMDYKWALPDQMAQAGFYHQPNTIGDDRAMCFTCVVCLVCWEPTDEPWSEHERHAPTCPFVRGEYTQNVPLSLNYATAPALSLSDRLYFGSSSLSSVIPTFSKKGLITLYRISRFMKVITEFHVPCTIGEYALQPAASQSNMFSDSNEAKSCLEAVTFTKTITENLLRSNNSFAVTACSILSISTYNKYMSDYENYVEKTGCAYVEDIQPRISNTHFSPCLVVGLKKVPQQDVISAWNSQTMNDDATTENPSKNDKCQLLLAVYDFHYKGSEDHDSYSSNFATTDERSAGSSRTLVAKKSGTGTGTAISRNKDCEYYSTKIYEATTSMLEDIGLMETESTSPNHTISVNNSLQSNASFVFPPLEAGQMTNNTTVNLIEPMDSILSSTTSTGTISPSEEKPRDPKTESELGDDASKNDRSKNAVSNNELLDLDKEVTLVQNFRILDQCSRHFEICGLHPLLDGQHLLVIIKNNEEERIEQSAVPDDVISGMLLLYRINFNNSVLCLEESCAAKRVLKAVGDEPKEFIMLPTFMKQDESYWPYGHIPMGVLLTASGELHLINLKNLETICVLFDESSKFVSIVYCDLLEKLCACDETGRLHYISILDRSYAVEQPTFAKEGSHQNNDKITQHFSNKFFILPEDLKKLLRLTYFENVTPCYLANVPSCWNEVKQAQKQRRHPQLLQQADSEQHTRSWKLQIGERTWDEHVFELTLMQNMCIGHVDVKFSLHASCQLVPNIQVTLLRLKNDGNMNDQRSKSTNNEASFSEGSSTSASSTADALSNPVNSKEYHLKHNTEVLCGPVNLVKYLDLSKRSGTITLTSPKLFHSCCRTLLLHVKALGGITQEATGSETKPAAEKPSQECKKKASEIVQKQYSKFYSSLFVPEDASAKKEQPAPVNISKKPSAGCDWIHELSVTIRKPKRVDIAGEKSTRCHMLENLEFVDDLLKAFCANSDPEYRLIAMDILVWIASIRMCRFRPIDGDISMQQLDFAQLVEAQFSELIKFGYIEGNRKLAHKVTKLLVACSMGCKDVQDSEVVRFDFQLLKILIDYIPQTLQCWSAGASRWFFQLIMYVLPPNRNHFINTSQKCFTLLNQVAKELHSRKNPYHLLLRTRYGLYGNPFETELFDTEPIIPGRSSSMPVTYANLVAGPNIVFNSAANNESGMSGFFSLLKPMNAKEFATKGVNQKMIANGISNSKADLSFLTGISASHYMKGLLEVEPLHFTCHATSDGTRVERVDTDIVDDEAIVNYYGPTSTNAPFQTAAFSPYQGGKKTEKVYIFQDISDMTQTPLETVMSEEAFQHFKMSVIPKIKQNSKNNMDVGKQLIVIDNQMAGPSYVPTPIYHDKVTYSEVHSGFSDNSLSWQQLLVPPPQQVIIIERMHSGAKRFVVLDFGSPICLTDMLVPSCLELLSLSIDIWTQSEELDGRRLVVASDISSKMLIMSDIQPPPICRFLKITAIGRYGMSTTKCRIPIGTFYGHSYVLPSDSYAEENAYIRPRSDVNLQILHGMMEDVQCRYGLVCSKLRDQLTPFLTSEIPNVDHMNHYLSKGKTKSPTEVESHRVNNLYKDCITFQHQMNLVRNVMNRICNKYPSPVTVTDMNVLLSSACTDKLRNLTEALLDLLLYIVYELGSQTPPVLYNMLSTEVCQDMFSWLCVGEDSRTQVSTCTLLVRLFGVQPGWGEFLMNTFTQLYSSNHHAVFPQDRVFVLLSYLGRKSILSSGNQNYVIEHILKALLKEFLPLIDTTAQGFIRGKLDLPLLSWLLMFFLQCVEVLPSAKTFSTEDGDSIEKDNDSIRWNFIQSEVPIHRKRMMIDKKGWSRHFRRAIQKKVLQSKQQLKDLEAAKKNFQVTTQALGKLSNHTLKLKQELQNVLKNMPLGVGSSPKLSIKTTKAVMNMVSNYGSSSSSWTDKPSRSSDCVIVPPITPAKVGVDRAHCLPVIRALVAFMLHVDVTCNVDLFLISCKVMSCLLKISNAPIALNEMLNEDQLVKLLQMAVWCENGQSMCGGKWTSHAITCLLQDIIDKTPKTRSVVRAARRKSSTPLEGGASSSTDFSDMTAMDADATDSFTLFVNNTSNIATEENNKDFLLMCSSTPKCDNAQLPCLMESDDSEVDENLEEYLMDERSIKETSPKSKNNLLPNVSVALDSRLEYGVEENTEVLLRNLADKSSCNLLQSVNAMLTTCAPSQGASNQFKMDHPLFLWTPPAGNNGPSTAQMFSSAFDRLLTTFNIMGSNNNLEETLGLWLLLINRNTSEQDSFINVVPSIPISGNTISSIMTAAYRRSPPSIRLWFLLFKTLTHALNLPPEENQSNKNAANSSSCSKSNDDSCKNSITIPEIIIQHEAFSFLLSDFLSSPFVDDMAGENVVRSFSGLLHRLADHIRANPAFDELGMRLKERLLEVLCTLLSNTGAIVGRRGPLDAQIAFLSLLQECEFIDVGFSQAIDIIMKLGDLLMSYVQHMNAIKCCTSAEIPANATSCFAPPALKSATSAQNADGRRVGPFSRDFLVMQLLRFATKLLRLSSEPSSIGQSAEFIIHSSQTDESKAVEQLRSTDDGALFARKPWLADVVIRHERKMYQFLSSVNSCYRSSLNEVTDWHVMPPLKPLTNHSTVADGIFHFLNAIFLKSSDYRQKIDVFCGYLSNCTSSYMASDNASLQLSDPMLWLLTRVLNEPNVVLYFIEKGGMGIVCANLQRCFSVILNQHSSTVSSVMQYMYGPHGFNVPTAATKGKKKHTVDRNEDGLINFAPLGTIVLDNPAAQPADVLLMSATPHRRARSAAWSYHFYPEEKSVDLKILLPCAVLLKEVHLQPHHMSLATSPKAVSLEISRGGGEYIPIQAPVRTSGLAFLHMTLYQPEVVTSVLIRCYKPKEASGIGLSQVRLLGYSAFGDRTWRNTYNDLPNDYQLMNTATSWLRLYHHNLSVTRNASDVEYLILETLASSRDTISCVCGLLLLPSPLPKQFNRVLAQVMLKLGLHSKELCLDVIRTVLRNGISDNYSCGKPVDPATTNSVFELLHKLCCSTDQYAVDRVTMMLEWLAEVAEASMKSDNAETPIPTYVYCISCILWASQESLVNYDLPALLTSSLFDLLLKWSAGLPVTSSLKRAVDRVLCSMYVIKPENYICLLENLSIILNLSNANNSNESNVSDDLKERQHQFMHIKQPFMELSSTMLLVNSKHLLMSEKMFTTLSSVSQSHISAQQLIGCGFLALLVDSIIEFCQCNKTTENYTATFDMAGVVNFETSNILKRPTADDKLPMSHVDTISNILHFFSELCWEGSIRTWLGSSEICVFWQELLHFLCRTVPTMHSLGNDLPSESLLRLEDATIKFFSRCCWCYPKNQKTLAHIVCKVIEATPRTYSKYNLGLTDFTRRVLLQLILETEKIFVLVESNLPESADFKANVCSSVLFPPPSAYPSSSRHQLLYMNTNHTCVEIINQILGNNDAKESSGKIAKTVDADEEAGAGDEVLDELCDKITLAAGVTAKDKRLKDALADSLFEGNIKRMKKSGEKSSTESERNSSSRKLTLWVPTEAKYVNVCSELTISQMLQLLVDKGDNLETPIIKFLLVEQREEAIPDENKSKNLLEEFGYSELPSVLKEFVDTRGLEMVAHYLPMVYPTHYLRMVSSVYDSPICHDNDQKWVKLDVNDDIYEEVMDDKSANATISMGVHPEKRVFHTNENLTVSSVIPPHSLMAFGQFLKLPNYAELLIRGRKQAQCLLRLVLGGGDESDFNIACDPAKSLILNSLPTLPFEILRYLFKSTPLISDDGMQLRMSALRFGAIHVVLACLAIFTHQPEAIPKTDQNDHLVSLMIALKQSCSSVNSKKSEDKSHQYWAKGTGFGTGSTTQSWNVEQALGRQRFEEEHVTIFLQILASYINPDFKLQDEPQAYQENDLPKADSDQSQELPQLPNFFVELIKHSCLLPALASYLRNDSVLDMARHIPLYRSILMLMRVMAVHPQMVTFLLPAEYAARQTAASSSAEPVVVKDQTISLVELLQKMKICVETYTSRLKKSKETGESQDSSLKAEDEDESGEGLATLIPDINATAKIVEVITEKIISKTNALIGKQASYSSANTASIEEVYLRVMKKLQFDSFDMIVEDAEGLGFMFNVSYHFEPNVHSDGEKHMPMRMRRLAQEAVTLTTSLPLSYSSSVFVRCDTDRLDVMKVLITGPAETPYANGCFEFDVYFPPDYPNSPMLINLETTGRHSVRFNPNLYNDGKVCLSVLNTWHGRPEEKWNAQTSSFLQVLVSIQSLILVSEPYFNEPGYERSRGTASGNQSSREYNANIMQATVRWAMLDQIRNPSPCFKEIIQTHFWLKRNEITKQISNWINEIENEVGENSKANRTLSHGTMSLKCHYKMLCEEFAKLTPPPGLEEVGKSSQYDYKPPSSPTPSTPLSTPLVTLAEPVLPVPTSSDDDDEHDQDLVFEEIDEELGLPVFKKIDNLMAELD